MLCTLSRWMISRSQDTGAKLPRAIERHVGRCRDCGAFARASMALVSRLKSERSAFLAKVPEFSLDLDADRVPVRPERQAAYRPAPAPRHLLFGLRPLPVAAAALLLLVAAGVLVLQSNRRTVTANPQDLAAAKAAFRSLTTAPEGLPGAVGKAESALDRERRILEKSLVEAADYLQARLNIKIERKPSSKSS